MAVVAISREIEVFRQDALHRLPCIVDVAGRAPRVSHFSPPGSREGPSAHVEHHILFSAVLDGIGDFRILLLLVKPHVMPSAIVHLDEVEIPVTEIELAILFLMSCQTHAQSPCVLAFRTTGVVTGIAVYSRLQSQRVNVIHQRPHAAGKQFLVQTQMPVLGSAVPIAVVNVDITIAGLLQATLMHGVSLLANQVLVDIQSERVP